MNIAERDLQEFELDLWKDARKLEIVSLEDRKAIRRYSDNQTSISDEYQFISQLAPHVAFKIPEIIEYSENSITFEYIAGTRVFNLLMDLRHLYLNGKQSKFADIGLHAVELISKDLKEFQKTCKERSDWLKTLSRYPAGVKLSILYRILCSILGLQFDISELKEIALIYESAGNVPFRDASTKNVIINLPKMFKGRFDNDNQRLNVLKALIESGELEDHLAPEYIYHIDFSGCCYLCPEYDDWVAVKEHEASAWLKLDSIPEIKNMTDTELCVRFVRFSRFGGRKLAYRLLNRKGYEVRFEYDDEKFYFKELKLLALELKARRIIESKHLAELMDQLAKASQIQPETDYIHQWKQNDQHIKYYSDVFPR